MAARCIYTERNPKFLWWMPMFIIKNTLNILRTNLEAISIWTIKLCLNQGKANAKVKILFDVCRLIFDLFRFRYRFGLVYIGPCEYLHCRETTVLELPWQDKPPAATKSTHKNKKIKKFPTFHFSLCLQLLLHVFSRNKDKLKYTTKYKTWISFIPLINTF